MSSEQLSIFDMPVQNNNIPVVKPKVVLSTAKSLVQDIRTKGQKKNSIAFDVGEKIGGSRKDIAQQKKEFLEKPSLNLLRELEDTNVGAAAEVIVKETFFSWFSLENCKERAVEPDIAKAIQLFINRIPKSSKDSKQDREKYVNMLVFLSELLKSVKTKDEYYLFEYRVFAVINTVSNTERVENRISEYSAELATITNDENYKEKVLLQIQKDQAHLFLHDMAKKMALREYKGPFYNYFAKTQSRVNALKNAFSIKSWDELIPPVTEEKPKKRVARKPIWERELPETPLRSGGKDIVILDPKSFVQHFNFRAAEFGHYVKDDKGKEHLSRSAEAYSDLADILGVPVKALSLKGELAMAFGARGSGRALGHYEPGSKVINLTKERGSLGILAHEWFHSLDHYLFNASYSFKNGKPGYLTDKEYGEMSEEVVVTLHHLINEIKVGQSTAYLDVRDCKRKYKVYKVFKDLYEDVDGDFHQFMDRMIGSYDKRSEMMLAGIVSERRMTSQRASIARGRVREIRTNAEALAGYHFEMTGEKVDSIPYTTDRSNFYNHAINMDKGTIGKYWSSNRELAARAFESYVFEELNERQWTSDYLVCGIRDSVFPQGDERHSVFNAMREFIQAVRPYLID